MRNHALKCIALATVFLSGCASLHTNRSIEYTCFDVEILRHTLEKNHFLYSSITPEIMGRIRQRFPEEIDSEHFLLSSEDNQPFEEFADKLSVGTCPKASAMQEILRGRAESNRQLVNDWLSKSPSIESSHSKFIWSQKAPATEDERISNLKNYIVALVTALRSRGLSDTDVSRVRSQSCIDARPQGRRPLLSVRAKPRLCI
jgi:hypothetical protein